MKTIKAKIKALAIEYSTKLDQKMSERVKEMKMDDTTHYLIYRVLNISKEEGKNIDIYQNKGRFLYRYAGGFLEEATLLCFRYKFGSKLKTHEKIPNTEGSRPKNFEIDALIKNRAHEIKWRDATTDGDHVTKEHTRIKTIHKKGYIPIRVMFYYPNRVQSIRIQGTLETLYHGIGGEYYYGDLAWKYIKDTTQVDLKQILNEIAEENTKGMRN